ncbi:MAG: MFS transporter [Chloroflexi bacterium]|nr:MFS transporter [Chloroflexota bacterium]MYF78742.1 MFS transporter [Chloroflexota bacterium]MYK61716.1 MFS transporter [Chloroflexota bacterium]
MNLSSLAARPIHATRRIYRGYVVALLVFLSTGLSIGMTQYSFGEFAGPLQTRYGWNQTQLNLSLAFSFVSGLLAPIIGYWMDRFGVRPVMFVSLFLIAIGFVLRPFMTELWHWLALATLVYAGFPGATVLPAGKMVGLWFPNSMGRMTGIVVSGNNFGGMTMPPLAATIIALINWEWAYIIFAIIMFGLAAAVMVFLREKPRDVEVEMRRTHRPRPSASAAAARAGMSVKRAVKTWAFWLTLIGLVAATFTYQGVLTQLRQHFGENGFAPAAATSAVTFIATMGIASKIAFGRASERFSARKMTVLSTAFQALGVSLMILPFGGIPLIVAGIFIYSLGFGGLGALIVLVVQQTFGLREYASLMGLYQFAQIISIAGGPVLAGRVHDTTGSFDLAFATIVGIFIFGMITLFLARQPKWE